MLQKEFEALIGMQVDEKEYKAIEAMYMNAGEMSKETFAKCWKQCGANMLTVELAKECERLHGRLMEMYHANKERIERDKELADFLLNKACANKDRDLHREAVRLVGRKAATLAKLRMNLPLWDEDIAYVTENLK